MTIPPVRLPRGVERLICFALPAGWRRDAALGDLAELAAADRSPAGRAAVRRAALGLAFHYLRHRLARRARGAVSLPGRTSMFSIARDLRHAFRSLRRSPGFSLAAALTLAIGIGAAVTVFAALEAAVLRPLPYPDPERLVVGRTVWGDRVNMTSSAYDYEDLRDAVPGFAALATITPFTSAVTVRSAPEPERIQVALMSANLLDVLGVAPLLGRSFTVEEATVGGPDAVVLSHAYWLARFDGRREAVGETLSMNGAAATIVGVLPADFHLLVSADAFVPMRVGVGMASARRYHNFLMVGRMAAGVTLATLQAQVDTVASRLQQAYPDSNADKAFRVEPLQNLRTEFTGGPLRLLVGAAALLLLLAVINVGGLFLVRGTARRQEMAVRAALGAPRRHLGLQLALEGILIAVGAGALGLVTAASAGSLVLRVLPAETLGIDGLPLNAAIVAFTLSVSLLASALFGVIPGLRAARTSPARELVGARTTQSRHAVRFRTGIVVLQLALSVVLLAGAGLLGRTLAALNAVDLGFRTDSVLVLPVQLPAADYDQPARVRAVDALLEGARGIPGVVQAGAINLLPVRDPYNNVGIWNPDGPDVEPASRPLGYFRVVTPGHFETMGIELTAGRLPDETDREGSVPIALISESLAKLLYGDVNAIGRALMVDAGLEAPLEVVGVVGDVLVNGPGSAPVPVFYLPYAQRPLADMRLTLRVSGPVAGVSEALRAIIARLDSGLAMNRVEPMEDVVAASVTRPRLLATAVGIFAAAAIALASIGLYGVLAQTILQQRHDIGVRMALGANRSRIMRRVLREGARLALLGLTLGMAAFLAAARLISGLLYGVAPSDPLTLVAVALLLGIVAILASVLPARRAAVTDPVIALRAD